MRNRLKNAAAAVGSIAVAVGVLTAWVPSASASTASPAPCSARNLSAKVTGTGEGMSQPAVFVTVTNTSGRSCTVKGYPTIKVAKTKDGRQAFTVTKGAVNNAPQTKPRRIVLAPSGHAWFAIGTATAYDPPVVTFIKIAFATAPGGGRARVKVSLPASAPTGKPFPIGVTAFAPGVGTSQ